MLASRLVDCRVAVVVLERFGFLCFAILGGGKACLCRGKAVLVQLFVPCESLVEALLLLLLAILWIVAHALALGRLAVGSFWRLWCLSAVDAMC
jgi:hypothetical protein